MLIYELLLISIKFQSSLQKLQRSPYRYYSTESLSSLTAPWASLNSSGEVLAEVRAGRGVDRPKSGDVGRRRREGRGQGARGDHGASVEGFGRGGGGLQRRLDVCRRPAVSCATGGGAPMRLRGGYGAREVERLLAHQKVPEVGAGVARSGLSVAGRARRR